MTRRLVLSYLSITLFVLVVLEVPLGVTLARNERGQLSRDLERDAVVLAGQVEDGLQYGVPTDYEAITASYTERTGARVVVVDGAGISLADTSESFDIGRDFSTRPEIAAALSGQRNDGTRHSDTLDADLLYVAVPVASGGDIHGVVRVSYPTGVVDSRILDNWVRLGALAGVVLGAVAVVGVLLARSVTGPLRRLEEASAAMAEGDLSVRTDEGVGPPAVRRLAARFNVMASRLEHLVESQRWFVADASHQLRTPLTALRLRLEHLEPGAQEASRRDFDAAVAETERLSRLIDQLLLLARTEEGAAPVEPVDAAMVVGTQAEMWKPLAAEHGVTIDVAARGPTFADAVPGAIEQVIGNLLDNALSVAPAGSTVSVTVEAAGPFVELRVADAGPGMDEATRARAFDRFYRGPSGDTRGSGLGLAIVKELAVASRGEVMLASARQGGVEVVVRLRRATGRVSLPQGPGQQSAPFDRVDH